MDPTPQRVGVAGAVAIATALGMAGPAPLPGHHDPAAPPATARLTPAAPASLASVAPWAPLAAPARAARSARPAPAGTVPSPALVLPPAAERGLELVYAGDLRGAEGVFRDLADRDPGDPAGPYGLALVSWWRAFLTEGTPALIAECERRLEAALETVDDLRDDPVAEHFYRGRIYGTRAQLRALEQRWVAAARDAKRMRGELLEALERAPELADALAWVGIYDIVADRAPGLLKFAGFFLFLPRGDEDRGWRRLAAAAAGDGAFGPETRLYLGGLRYWARNDPAGGLAELEALGERYPDNGYLQSLIGWGRYEAFGDAAGANRAFSASLEATEEPLLGARTRYMRAYARFEAGLVEGALDDLEILARRSLPGLEHLAPRALLFESRIRAQIGDTEGAAAARRRIRAVDRWERFHDNALAEGARPHTEEETAIFRANLPGRQLAARGRLAEARAALREVLERHPDNPQTLFHLAEIDLAEGRFDEAAAGFTAVARQAPRVPTWLAPWAWVKAGWAHDARGERSAAAEAYEATRAYERNYDDGAVVTAARFEERPYRPAR